MKLTAPGDRYLLGVDVGTTALKTVLIDTSGSVVAADQLEYATFYPKPNTAEQEPEDWWRAAGHTIRAVLARSRIDPAAVMGIGVSCQAPTLLPVNRNGRPLTRAHIWMDRRAQPHCDRLRRRIDASWVRSVSGADLDPFYVAPKIVWLKQERRDLYAETHFFVQINGYINYRLTGVWSMDLSHGGLTGLFDIRSGEWSAELCEAIGVDIRKLPPIRRATDIIGTVTPQAAADTGLTAGTPVVAGTVDGTAAALEAGVIEPGHACEMTGQSTVVLMCTDRPFLDTPLTVMHHAVPGRFLLLGAMVSGGGNLRWFRDQFGVGESAAGQTGLDPFELLSLEASRSGPGSGGTVFLPYMYGERAPIWNSNARGVFFGLSLASERSDIVRSLMEGTAYGLRHNLEAAEAAGVRVDRLRSVGGATKSDLWNQIKADVTGKVVELPRVAAGAPLADALLAGVGTGIFPDISTAVESVVKVQKSFTPDPDRPRIYDRYYSIFRSIYDHLKPDFDTLAAANAETRAAGDLQA